MARLTKYQKLQKLNLQLIDMSKEGNLELVKFLIKEGANIHAKNDDALNHAALEGHLEVVEYLIEQGANLHSQNNGPLFYASFYGHLEVVKYLVDKGADVLSRDEEVLAYAVAYSKSKEFSDRLENDLQKNISQENIKKVKI